MIELTVHDRHYDWYSRLLDLIDESYMRRFEYGTFDCALWAADAWKVQLQDNYDIAAKWRGKYKTLASGMKLITKAGYTDYIDVFAKELPIIPASMAQSGDLVVVGGQNGLESLGVVVKNIIYAPTETCLGVMTLTDGIKAFAVGRRVGE